MRLLCGTCRAVYDASDGGELRCETCRTLPQEARPAGSPRSSSSPRECWFVRERDGDGQAGPYSASELSQQLLSGQLAWTAEVWREGLPSFRPARRDDLLVLAVAGVRGLAGQTTRLDSVQALLQASAESRLPPSQAAPTLAPASLATLSVSARATLAGPGAAGRAATRPLPPAPPARAPHSPSRPATLQRQQLSARTMPPRRPLTIPPPPPPSLPQRPSVPPGSLSRGSLPGAAPRRSGGALGIALLAFCAGAVVALGPSQLFEVARALPQGLRVQVSHPAPAALAEPAPLLTASGPLAPAPSSLPQAAVVAPEAEAVVPVAPAAAVSVAESVQAELTRIGSTLQRCVPQPHHALALALTVAGPSGRIEQLEVSAPALRPGARACVQEAFADFRVSSFEQPSLRLKHRYMW